MTTFVFNEQVSDTIKNTVSCALGAAPNNGTSNSELGKAYKMGTVQNYVPCADGDPIEGFVTSLEGFTVNGGYEFGAIQRGGRKTCQVATGATVTLLGYVVAGAQLPIGTAGLPQVKAATYTAATDDGPQTQAGDYVWRVIRIITGTGVAGDQVMVESV